MIKLTLVALLLLCGQASALSNQEQRTLIKVGASPHEPFYFEEDHRGLTVDLVNEMNQAQQKYQFEIIKLPAKRAFQFANMKWVDIFSWDNLKWGWNDNHSVEASIPLIDEKDRFIALSKGSRDQQYFKDLDNKRLVLINGYHYHFTNFVTNHKELSKLFRIDLVKTEYLALQMIVSGRADVTVVSESSLAWYLAQHPEVSQKLLISEKYDSQYKRYFLLAEHAPINVEELNQLIKRLALNGTLQRLYQQYGLTPPIYH